MTAQAENAYRTGDFATADSYADTALPVAQQVTTQAVTLQENAEASAQTSFWYTIAVTIAAAAVFIVALFLGWRLLKRRYIKNMLEAKPEVVDQ